MRARTAIRIAVALAAQATLLLVPATSPAERSFDSSVPGFSSPGSVAVDSQGAVWITDAGRFNPPGPRGLYKHSPYPSQTLLIEPNTNPAFGFSAISLQGAVNWATGEVFVAQSSGRTIAIFDQDGTYLRTWQSINGASGGGGPSGSIHVAIDNTNGFSRGRVYLSLTAPENSIQAFDDQQRPVEFPATAPYIQDHRITGTPGGPFGEVQFIAVDHLGRIYVTDTVKDVVDVFESTGEFVRALPAPKVVSNYTVNGAGIGGVAVDPTNGDVFVTEGLAELTEGGIREYDQWGNYLGQISDYAPGQTLFAHGTPAVDSAGHLYVPGGDSVNIFEPAPPRATIAYGPVSDDSTESGTVHATIDPNGGGEITDCEIQYGTGPGYGSKVDCTPDPGSAPPGSHFSSATEVSAVLPGLATETTYHYRAVVESGGEPVYGSDQTYTPHDVIGLRTDPASGVAETGATLNASLVGDGTETHYLFEWGKTSAYGNVSATAPGDPAGSPAGPERKDLFFVLDTLAPFTTYHYRVVAQGGGGTSLGEDEVFTTPPGVPTIGAQSVSDVHSDRAVLHGELTPNGADTTAQFEYVSDAAFQESGFSTALKSPTPAEAVGRGKKSRTVSVSLDELSPGTLYHFRLVGTNAAGVGVPNVDRTFFTYRAGFEDTCPNAHVRQQTGAALLFDCRAYELASAYDAGGYDVESDLVPGQDPFPAHPMAIGPSQLLYGVASGGIPGTGSPTNHGLDPYVATRDESGWKTTYVGVPADNSFANGPFGSPLLEADAGLDTFAFAGPDICSPCFADGKSGIPIHLPDGRLVQGMAGALDPGPGAAPAGYVARHLSADGTHFVFGSTSRFETDGNSNGDVSIYLRDLASGETRVVSKTPGGTTMTGAGIGELDISSDGGRVVVGQQLSTGPSGNRHWHLYMSADGADQTIDLTPGTAGVLYNGMTADGTKVFFSTADQLTADDEDSSVDLYRADVDGSTAVLSRVSTGVGGSGNTDGCDPSANTVHPRWNNLASAATCDVLAVGGGGGVAAEDGSVYFLSPEALDLGTPGNQPIEDAPNLYVARPGQQPRFIRTLESSATAPIPVGAHPFRRYFGVFKSPRGAAIDNSNGDIYVFDAGNEPTLAEVQKFNSNGQLQTSFAVGGRLAAPESFSAIAVDNTPGSPNQGALFVPSPFGFKVNVYEPSGSFLKEMPSFIPTAVAVHPVSGDIYIAGLFGTVEIFEPDGTPAGGFSTIFAPTGIAVDSTGKVFVTNGFEGDGVVHAYSSSGTDLGEFDPGPAKGVSVDPMDDHLYVDRGDRVIEFDSTGQVVNTPVGVGQVANSFGVAAASGNVAVTNGSAGNVALYGPAVTPSDPAVDNPLVIDSLESSAEHRLDDFQLSPVGNHAVFTSTRSLTGYDNGAHRQVYRYDAQSDTLDCASCNPTGQRSTGDATLPPHGQSVTDDGRVFFNSTEGLVDRDLNQQKDAYEWKPGEGTELISTGTAALGASLLGVSADGTDAYFFTREELVAEDANGRRVKIYDARADGGFPFVPPPVPCKASDECHGPGSVAPPAPGIGSVAGTPIGNAAAPKKCKRKKTCGQRRKHQKHRKKKQGRRGHK